MFSAGDPTLPRTGIFFPKFRKWKKPSKNAIFSSNVEKKAYYKYHPPHTHTHTHTTDTAQIYDASNPKQTFSGLV